MLVHFLSLGVSPSASDEEVRRIYLQRIREHPPGRDPDRFQQVTAAYEALKDQRSRIRTSLFGYAEYGDHSLALEALKEAMADQRQTPGLATLLVAEGKRARKTESDEHAG